tara:strand:+ start:408 stop:776 length:369 start_codon:yes stop_codon:yes gene_type:complete
MKNPIVILFMLLSMVGISSCGVGHAYVLNQNQNTTQVELSEPNFKVVGQVSGSSEVEYVLFFGGIKKRNLYQDAYSTMMEEAGLIGKSRAITNITTEEHLGGVPPFYSKRTITVSAHVIEFN